MIGEAEVSSYNAMSACKSTFESSCVGVQFDAYDMVWTAWNAEWACQKGTVRGYPFGSWSLPMIWKLCCGQAESSVISRDDFWMMQCRALALVQLQPSNVDFKPREAVLLCYEIVVYDRRSSQMLWSCTSSHSILACMPLKLLWQVLWCSSHSIPACMLLKLLWQMLWCLSNCRDVPTLNFAIVKI